MSDPDTSLSSKALASIIVVYRALGLAKEEARSAMAELSRRESEGDDFDFEEFIKKELDALPQPELNPQAMNIMSSLVHMSKNK